MLCPKGDPSDKWFGGRIVGTNCHRKWWVYANSQPFLDGKLSPFINYPIRVYEYAEYPKEFIPYRNGV